MGLQLVEVNQEIVEHLPECVLGAQILQLLEASNLHRSSGLWSISPRSGEKFVMRSLDDTPLLVAKKQPRIVGYHIQPGEQVAWGEFKQPENFTPGSVAIEPLQFVAGSLVALKLGNEAVEVELSEDEEYLPDNDGPSSCSFEVGNPTVQFGLVSIEDIYNPQLLDFGEE